MEFTKVEIAAINETSKDASEAQVQQLSELQLTFVGGGIADVIGA